MTDMEFSEITDKNKQVRGLAGEVFLCLDR